ncbi:hypothetical protein D9M71_556560 [compost metagenome]
MQVLSDIDADLFYVSQNPLGVVKQRLTRCGEPHAFGITLKNLNAQCLLHVVHALAGSGQCDHFALRTSRQRPLLVHRDEQLEGHEVDPTNELLM